MKLDKNLNIQLLHDRFTKANSYGVMNSNAMLALYTYVLPDRKSYSFNFNSNTFARTNFYGHCFDDTAVVAARQRANDLHGLLLPTGKNWGQIGLNPIKYKNSSITSEINQGLDKVNDLIHKYLNASTLARAVAASNLDLIGGTGAIWVESKSDEEPLEFKSIPIDSLILEYSNNDLVDTCWFKQEVSARYLLELYPKYKEINYLKDNINNNVEMIVGQIKFPVNKSYQYYIYATLTQYPTTLLWEKVNSYKQIIIYRDSILPGNVHGFGIGMIKLPSIWRLNHMLATYHENLALISKPPLFVDNDLVNNPSVTGSFVGAIIPRGHASRNPIDVMQFPTSPLPLHEIDTIRLSIQRDFQVNVLGDVGGPIPSATEVAYREELAQRRNATDISRLINELPKQIYETAYDILFKRGFFDGILPKQLLKNISFFINPLEDLQKRTNVANLLATSQAIIQTGTTALETAIINPEKKARYIAQNNGVPAELLNSPEEAKAIIANLVQAASTNVPNLLQSAATQNIPITATPNVQL